jgi:hypothetical protein
MAGEHMPGILPSFTARYDLVLKILHSSGVWGTWVDECEISGSKQEF